MNTIYKYPILPDTPFFLSLPEGAKILTVNTQHGEPQLWALVDINLPLEERTFLSFATGEEITHNSEDLTYIGTVFLYGSLVFHIFELL